MSTNNDILDEIKSRCNIVDVVGAVVPLKKAGANFKGNCPFHNEKTASFVVSEQKQIFTCFGCGATGDVIEFVKRYYNLDFLGAIEKLGTEYGIETNRLSTGNSKEKDAFFSANREAALFFVKAFYESNNPGYKYMENRGLDIKTLKTFGIGYADKSMDSLRNYLNSKGYDDKTLLQIGLISEKNGKYYDKFRERVMFPIINTSGKVIGFGGRAIGDGEPKYLNSPESSIFLKKNNLYALNTTRNAIASQNQAILVEGYMDVISLYQGGVLNVTASLGTALTENQAKLLKRYTKNIVLSYDSDAAGQKAAIRGGEILYKADMKIKVLHVTEGKDPDEFIKKRGKLAFLDLINNAPSYAEYRIENIKKNTYNDTNEGRVEFLKETANFLQELNPAEQDIYIKNIAETYGFSEEALKRQVQGAKQIAAKAAAAVSRREKPKEEPAVISGLEKNLIKLILINIDNYKEISKHGNIFESKSGKAIFHAIKEQAEKETDFIDVLLLADSLEDEEYISTLDSIEKNVMIINESETLKDCLIDIEERNLKGLEREIQDRMEIADDIGDNEESQKLAAELIDIKKAIMEIRKKKNS